MWPAGSGCFSAMIRYIEIENSHVVYVFQLDIWGPCRYQLCHTSLFGNLFRSQMRYAVNVKRLSDEVGAIDGWIAYMRILVYG
jgi:hypothetical protein